MNKLNYRFGDDGIFWMAYDDMLKRFDLLDRTRLFDKDWTVVQAWTSVSVAWVTGFLTTKFQVEIKKAGPTVFVLAQLDERYFLGLEGKYYFDLHFILQEAGAGPGDHIVRVRGAWFGNRSISAEVDLEPGKYEVVPKIVAWKDDDRPDVYDVVQKLANKNPQKLRQIGMNYDIANAKGVTAVTEEARKKREAKKKEAEEKKKREEEEGEKERKEFETWKREKKEREEREKAEKGESKDTAKEDAKEGENKDEQAAEKKVVDDKKAEEKEDPPKEEENKDSTLVESTPKKEEALQDATAAPTSDETQKSDTKTNPTPADAAAPADKKDTDTTYSADAPAPAAREQPSATAAAPDAHVSTEEPTPAPAPAPTEAAAAPAKEEDKTTKPWNAVCVLGLRVYSKDAEVSIKLVGPKDAEEGAVLDVDGVIQAGATM